MGESQPDKYETEGERTIYIFPFVLKWKSIIYLKKVWFLHYKGISKYDGNIML